MSPLYPKLLKATPTLLTYLCGQGGIQLFQLVTGFILVNLMTKESYADYTLMLAILGFASMLLELGISQTLTGLIGSKIKDPVSVGRYLTACMYYRNRLLFTGIPLLLIVFVFFGQKYEWSWLSCLVMWGSVSLILFFQALRSIYQPLLMLEKRLKESYTIGLSSSALRLALIIAYHLLAALVAPAVILITAVKEGVEALWQRRITRAQVEFPGRTIDVSEEKRAILSQSLPRIPSLFFNSFSAQFIIFAMGIFGSQSGVAELGALSRLAMLFIIIQKSGSVLIAPHFSKLPGASVRRQGRLLFAGLGLGSFFICLFAYFFPRALLVVLGDGYQHLEFEVVLVVAAALIRSSSMLVFSVCLARKYIFKWYSLVDISPQLIVICIFVACFDLSDLRTLLYFSIGIAVAKLFSKLYIFSIGARKEASA